MAGVVIILVARRAVRLRHYRTRRASRQGDRGDRENLQRYSHRSLRQTGQSSARSVGKASAPQPNRVPRVAVKSQDRPEDHGVGKLLRGGGQRLLRRTRRPIYPL
jgi:hypothetical protein